MRISAYVRLYLFRIVHVFWTARECVYGLASMFRHRSSQSLGSTSQLFSEYTLSLCHDVYWENNGKVLLKFRLRRERSIEANLIYASLGGIKTYSSPIRR